MCHEAKQNGSYVETHVNESNGNFETPLGSCNKPYSADNTVSGRITWKPKGEYIRTGPINGAAAKTLCAFPLSAAENISAIMPPAFVS
jgi:hypothetical protein